MSDGVEQGSESRDSLIFNDSKQHWQQFGLHSSPFDDLLDVYYPAQSWEEHLRYLQHFRTASYPLLLIPGIVGSGKSTLVKRFLEMNRDPEHIHCIEAQSHHTVAHFVEMIYEASGLGSHFETNNAEEFNHLDFLAREAGPQYLFIDNAHRLSRETLTQLLQLLFSQHLEQTQFRVVLVGESQLQETVMNLLDAFAPGRQVPTLQLEPFSVQEVQEYLEFRFEQAGLNQDLPFTSALLKQIHLLSGGFPGRINRVAQQVFVDAMKNDHQDFPQPTSTSLLQGKSMKLMGFAVFFALFLLVWQMNSHWNGASAAGIDSLKTNIASLAPVQKVSAKEVLAKMDRRSQETSSEPSTPTDSSSGVREAIAMAINHIQEAEAADLEQDESFSMPVVRNQHLLSGAVMADLSTSTTVAAAPTSENAKATTLASADSITGAELQLMASQGYTIQVMAVREPQLFDGFIAENNLSDVSYYRTKMNHQDWYVLVYGHFESIEDAKAALAKLPVAVKKQQPWVRSFDGVRQAIEVAHQKEMPQDSAKVAVR